MRHLGDITKINGAEVPPVHIITGGSPCQDLSVAGKRAGLAGERSGLFMEQIRIIKEMREHDKADGRTDVDIRPRYMVWENVPGAFSSNGGEDFRAVLEETAKIVQSDISIPRPQNGKWAHAGCIMGDGWYIAWRLHDAQYWGVPQRRKRISLVADFAGASALEILFERESLSGDSQPSTEKRQGTARDAEGRSRETGEEEPVTYRGDSITHPTNKSNPHPGDPCHTLTDDAVEQHVVYDGRGNGNGKVSPSLVGDHQRRITDFTAIVIDAYQHHGWRESETVGTITARQSKGVGGSENLVVEPVCIGNGQVHDAMSPSVGVSKTLNCIEDPMKIITVPHGGFMTNAEVAHTIQATDYKDPQIITYGLDMYNQSQTPDVSMSITGAATDPHHIPCTYHGGGSVVRRLTPN